LKEKVSAPVQKIEITAVGIRHTDHVTPLYSQRFSLISTTSGGRSVGIVLSQTQATVLLFVCKCPMKLHGSHFYISSSSAVFVLLNSFHISISPLPFTIKTLHYLQVLFLKLRKFKCRAATRARIWILLQSEKGKPYAYTEEGIMAVTV
jgi:hypothetical protein